MKYATAKLAGDVTLNGVTVEFVTEDKAVKEVRVRDAEGNLMVVKKGSDYGEALRVLVPAPLEQQKRYKLSGNFLNLTPVSEFFEDKHEADGRLEEYRAKAPHSDDCGLKVEPVDVLVDETGAVIKEAA